MSSSWLALKNASDRVWDRVFSKKLYKPDGGPPQCSISEVWQLGQGARTRWKINILLCIRIDTSFAFGLTIMISMPSIWFWIRAVILNSCTPVCHDPPPPLQFDLGHQIDKRPSIRQCHDNGLVAMALCRSTTQVECWCVCTLAYWSAIVEKNCHELKPFLLLLD